ncbi:G protein-coupled receptor rhodopsin-like, partial [Trinorchestia longiramus]
YRYLARLAASDLLYLLFNIPFCLEEFAFTSDGLPVSESAAIYYAYIAVPVVNFFLTLSVYIIVWLSYDRWLAVCNPHKFPTQQTLVVVHRRCVVTFLVTFAMYVPCPLRQTYTCYPSSSDAEATVCCVHESEYMGHQWYYFYEFCREVYSRFLPGILITAFNFAIIWTLRLAKRGKKFNSNPKLGQEIHIQMPMQTSVVSDAKKLEDTAVVVACMGLQHLSLNCCSDITSSPVLLERVE